MVGGSTEQKQPLLLGMLTQLSQAWDWHWLYLLLKQASGSISSLYMTGDN